ncbi:unnamed protein product [Calypogeia fissa]
MSRFMQEKDAAMIWVSLKNLYGANTTPHRLMLKKQLSQLCFTDGKSMGENFKEFSILLTKLARIEVNPEATDLVDLVLGALPTSWHAFGSMIAARESLPSLTELEQLIMTEETRRLAIEEPIGEALAAHQA